MITLRPYQEEAIETIMASMLQDRYMLLQAATGAGKTIIFSELIKRLLKEFRMRIAVLAHRRELIIQTADKLRKVWPGVPLGIACAGVTGNINLHSPVVVGSIQTLATRANRTAPFHLIILDEVHRLPAKNKESQFRQFLDKMESNFSDLRVLGVTATPYRLAHGYIYGTECKPGFENWFSKLHFRIGIRDLQEQGFLCGVRAKEAENIEAELMGIRTTGGEYNLQDLSDLMSREVHVGSAVNAYREYGENRKHVVVFCVTIEHAKLVRHAFQEAGLSTGCVHSEMTLQERDRVLADYESGKLRILTNVGVLQEGWDSPQTDCIILCRPTKSPALYVQQIGRALRIHPGKEDMLILDLSGNIHTHGDPDNPQIKIPGISKKAPPPATKTCPQCKGIVLATAKECRCIVLSPEGIARECGYQWPAPELVERNEPVVLVDVQWKAPEQRYLKIEDIEPVEYESKAGNKMLKLFVHGSLNGGKLPKRLMDFLDFEGNASEYGRKKARMFWRQLGGDEPPPDTIQEALERFDELTVPEEVKVREDGPYLKIVGW